MHMRASYIRISGLHTLRYFAKFQKICKSFCEVCVMLLGICEALFYRMLCPALIEERVYFQVF